MRFRTLPPRQRPDASATDGVYLEANTWSDYGFRTFWTVHFVASGASAVIGPVKIADNLGSSSPTLPGKFTNLDSQFFSLGQEEDYYERLKQLGDKNRIAILRGLRDAAFDLDLFRRVIDLKVTQQSLLRSVTAAAVHNQFHRIALGGVKLSPYSFSYHSPATDRRGFSIPRTSFEFRVVPYEKPRSNMHVIVGSNGVGKSYMLNDMASALTYQKESKGVLEFDEADDRLLAHKFANVVSVAYSAFDAFEPVRQSNADAAIKHHYVGLKKLASSSNASSSGIKSHNAIAQEFGRSIKNLLEMRRLIRWSHYIEFLKTDSVFSENVSRITNVEPEELRDNARQVFRELSSGHQIVLLIITRLVETVEEASLVLIDEPESHLHPPLLAAFMRALAELLEDRNAVAIIATHSPVVVQEVPSNCVWKVAGSGGALTASRPASQTYGENVGSLTQEIFGLEVEASGFHLALKESVQQGEGYDQILASFRGRLGAEARALLRSMTFLNGR